MVKLMKTNRKVVEDRQQRILNLVRDRDEVRNEELASELGVSLMTVRRDLGLLEQAAEADAWRRYWAYR